MRYIHGIASERRVLTIAVADLPQTLIGSALGNGQRGQVEKDRDGTHRVSLLLHPYTRLVENWHMWCYPWLLHKLRATRELL